MTAAFQLAAVGVRMRALVSASAAAAASIEYSESLVVAHV
jgi:hypothetical protein